jgi:hypothetical protein
VFDAWIGREGSELICHLDIFEIVPFIVLEVILDIMHALLVVFNSSVIGLDGRGEFVIFAK